MWVRGLAALVASGAMAWPASALPRPGAGQPDASIEAVAAKKKAKPPAPPAAKPAIDPATKAAFEAQLAKAEAGDWSAMYYIASSYERGEGVAKDEKLSLSWHQRRQDAFLKAAEAGDPEAMQQLVDAYATGSRVVAVDLAKAAVWLGRKRAAILERARKGDAEAMETLAGLLESPELEGAAPDYSGSLIWLEKAAAAGRYSAMIELARKYDEGQDVPADRAQAFQWFLKAAGNPEYPWDARIMLANKYKTGDGVTKNLAEAARLHVEIAENSGGWRKRMRASTFAADVTRSEPGYRAAVQKELSERGLYAGPVDGHPSKALDDAIAKVWRRKVKEE